MSKTIEIIVTPEGRTTVETHGFAGASCQDDLQEIESHIRDYDFQQALTVQQRLSRRLL